MTEPREGAQPDDWHSRHRELREEYFAMMDQLADGVITPARARSETARINDEMAILIRMTVKRRRRLDGDETHAGDRHPD